MDLLEEEALLADLNAWYLEAGLARRWNELRIMSLLMQVPRLGAALRGLGVRVTYAAAIVIHEGDSTIIHIDHMPGVKARLLLPLHNTAHSHTAFYRALTPPRMVPIYDGGLPSLQFIPDQVEEVDRFTLLRPVVLRIDQPHAIHCTGAAYPRASLTLRLNIDPVRWLEGA